MVVVFRRLQIEVKEYDLGVVGLPDSEDTVAERDRCYGKLKRRAEISARGESGKGDHSWNENTLPYLESLLEYVDGCCK